MRKNATHELRVSYLVWLRLMLWLRLKSRGYRESGAFLLGHKSDTCLTVTKIVPYDLLDPDAFASGVVVLQSQAFSRLWSICRAKELTVVADIHTHPNGVGQSISDRKNPMIPEIEHIALIVPNFGRIAPFDTSQIGIYEYVGDYEWRTWDLGDIERNFRFRIW